MYLMNIESNAVLMGCICLLFNLHIFQYNTLNYFNFIYQIFIMML